MAVLPSDLIAYASLNMPSDDVSTSGGAIDVDTRVVFTQLASVAALEILSSSAADTTPQATVRARTAAGSVLSQTVTLTGVTPVSLSTLGTVERVLKVSLNADAAGIVTLRVASGGATVGTIPIGERGFLAFHREGQCSSSAEVDFYYKFFIKNTSGTDTLTSGSVAETLDSPNRITFALAASINDSASVANRLTVPALTFNNSAKSVPASLAPGDAIGVWLLAAHPAGDGSSNTSLGLQISGV